MSVLSLNDLVQFLGSLGDEEEDRLSRPSRSRNKKPSSLALKMEEDETIEAAIGDLYSPVLETRKAGIRTLKALGIAAARRMVELLYDGNPKVRYNACLVLASTGDRESFKHSKLVENDQADAGSGTVAEAAALAKREIRKRTGF